MNPPRDAVRHRCSSSTRRRCAAATHRTFPVYLLGGARGNSQARLPPAPRGAGSPHPSSRTSSRPRPVPHPAADILQHAGALRRLGTLFFVLAVFGRPVISRSRPHAVNILGRFNLPAPLLNRQGRAPLHGLQDDTVRLLRESRLQQLLSLIIYIYTTDTTNYINSTRPDGIH